MTNEYKLLVEGKYESIDFLEKNELDFFLKKELIVINGSSFKVAFVGEIITTENSYFSLPKNFEKTEENVNLFKKVLDSYRTFKKDGKTLLTNNTFTVSNTGDIKSEKFYFNQLKDYFLDYITYEFIYPKKRIQKHSTSPMSGGKIDVFTTMKNRKQKGPGITYKTKDIVNSKDWKLDDIYWSVINQLSQRYANTDDLRRITELKDSLNKEGYKIENIDISNREQAIKDINKCEVGIIHQPIKSTLLSYFKDRSIGEKYSINVFYTLKFQYVWEELLRKSLKENKDFRNELRHRFERKETRTKWFTNKENLEIFTIANRIKDWSEKEIGTGIRIQYEVDVKSIPDIFSDHDNKRFIGDAKYYQDPENSEFEKEFRTYNSLTENRYPMVVFVPGVKTKVLQTRKEGDLELIIFHISVQESIKDSIDDTNNTIEKVQTLIGKYTDRFFNRY